MIWSLRSAFFIIDMGANKVVFKNKMEQALHKASRTEDISALGCALRCAAQSPPYAAGGGTSKEGSRRQ